MVGDFTYLYLEPCDKNCNISCRSKMLSSWTFWLLKLTEVTSNQESVSQLHGVLIYKRAMDLTISVYFDQVVLFGSKSSDIFSVCL